MTRSLIPAISTLSLACMIAAGASHWWSVRQFTTTINMSSPTTRATALQTPTLASSEPITPQTPAAPQQESATIPDQPPVGGPVAMQQQFYHELIREMQHLRTQNRDLLNQVAETNRDLMKLEFRVDTHSDQFRPLPVAEETFNASFGTSFDDSPGLLPPRAEPVEPAFTE